VNRVPGDTAEFQTWNLPADRLHFFVTAFVFILFVCLFVLQYVAG
jgi:hypothetical protein